MARLDGKVAFITGAARGQGRAHAMTLAREGADIVALDIADQIETVSYEMATQDDLDKTVALVEDLDRRCVAVKADVRSQEQLDQAVERGISEFGKIDILLANAGIWSLGPFWEMAEQQWDDMIDTNLTGVWKSCKAVAPHMIERRQGAIVMTSSVNGLEPGPNYAHYVAAKHGMIGLMRNVALDLAPYGVRSNAVCPGAIDTGMTNWQGAYDMYAGHEGGTREEFVEGARSFHALAGRSVLPPEAISNAVLWLVSDEAEHVTGVALPVDAGHMILPSVNQAPTR